MRKFLVFLLLAVLAGPCLAAAEEKTVRYIARRWPHPSLNGYPVAELRELPLSPAGGVRASAPALERHDVPRRKTSPARPRLTNSLFRSRSHTSSGIANSGPRPTVFVLLCLRGTSGGEGLR